MSDTTAPAVAPPLQPDLNFKLSGMMFLQYAIWGAWLPLLWPFLANVRGLEPEQIGLMFSVGAVGAIIAPFLAGQIADRHFSTQKFLGFSHLLGAVLVWQLATIESYWGFLVFSLVYSLIYSPTLSLTNSLAFHHLPDRDRDFGRVRVWGTVGWIVVGIGIGQWLAARHSDAVFEGMADAFRLSGILGFAMGLYCFTLPDTPPSKSGKKNASLEAMGEVRRQPLITLFLLAVPISCIHQFYFVHTAQFLGDIQDQGSGQGLADAINSVFGKGGGGLMTIGQMAEIGVLALIPLIASKVSRKSLLAVGIVAYALRMLLFSYAPAWGSAALPMIVAGVALHGLCFGCFIFVAFMIVDEECGADVKASAQSLFNLVIIGVGVIVGSLIAGFVASWASYEVGQDAEGNIITAIDYAKLFPVPMWAAWACLLALLLFYPGGRRSSTAD